MDGIYKHLLDQTNIDKLVIDNKLSQIHIIDLISTLLLFIIILL